ncbi:MAG: FecR domain-containing protein [Deltaproteobacteria bacterium]|nr:FecR domain-containing protein [Deltaproteobacteria bacterium]
MNQACREQAELMIADLQGELLPLERTRLEAHLANCGRCTALQGQLRHGLEAARHWSPEVDPEHLDRLVDRLTPYVGAYSARPRWVLGLSLAGAVAAAALFAFVRLELAATEAPLIAPRERSAGELSTSRPTPHIRMIKSGDWAGQVQLADANTVRVTMSRGFAVFDFEGGEGRAMRVEAPGVDVDVVGTRFFVEVNGARTKVGVGRGKVKVHTVRATDLVVAGDARTYAASGEAIQGGPPAEASRHLEDPFFAAALSEPAPPVEVAAAPPPDPAARAAAAPPAVSAVTDPPAASAVTDPPAASAVTAPPAASAVTDPPAASAVTAPPAVSAVTAPPAVRRLFVRAESLARRGRARSALAVYRSIAESQDSAGAPYAAIARYEMARIYAGPLARDATARALFTELTKSSNTEVAHQARLARCELDLTRAPCRSAACLRSIIEEGPAVAAAEAGQLLSRWHLEELACPASRDPPSPSDRAK